MFASFSLIQLFQMYYFTFKLFCRETRIKTQLRYWFLCLMLYCFFLHPCSCFIIVAGVMSILRFSGTRTWDVSEEKWHRALGCSSTLVYWGKTKMADQFRWHGSCVIRWSRCTENMALLLIFNELFFLKGNSEVDSGVGVSLPAGVSVFWRPTRPADLVFVPGY